MRKREGKKETEAGVAARMDVAYQALIKIWLSEKIKEVKHGNTPLS